MKHTSLYLDDEIHKALRKEAIEHGIAMTELIRRLVEDHLRKAGYNVSRRGEPPRPGRKQTDKARK